MGVQDDHAVPLDPGDVNAHAALELGLLDEGLDLQHVAVGPQVLAAYADGLQLVLLVQVDAALLPLRANFRSDSTRGEFYRESTIVLGYGAPYFFCQIPRRCLGVIRIKLCVL